MSLVRTYEDMVFEIRKKIGKIVSELTRDLRGIERMEKHIELMEEFFHIYRKIKRSSVNLFRGVLYS